MRPTRSSPSTGAHHHHHRSAAHQQPTMDVYTADGTRCYTVPLSAISHRGLPPPTKDGVPTTAATTSPFTSAASPSSPMALAGTVVGGAEGGSAAPSPASPSTTATTSTSTTSAPFAHGPVLCRAHCDAVDASTRAHHTGNNTNISVGGAPRHQTLTNTNTTTTTCTTTTTGCTNGANCPHVHIDVPLSTLRSEIVHTHYLWRDETCVTYDRLTSTMARDHPRMRPDEVANTLLEVYGPNNREPYEMLQTSKVLHTRGARYAFDAAIGAPNRTPSTSRPCHCAHYYFNQICNRGASCAFIHVVSTDAKLRDPCVKATNYHRRIAILAGEAATSNNSCSVTTATGSPSIARASAGGLPTATTTSPPTAAGVEGRSSGGGLTKSNSFDKSNTNNNNNSPSSPNMSTTPHLGSSNSPMPNLTPNSPQQHYNNSNSNNRHHQQQGNGGGSGYGFGSASTAASPATPPPMHSPGNQQVSPQLSYLNNNNNTNTNTYTNNTNNNNTNYTSFGNNNQQQQQQPPRHGNSSNNSPPSYGGNTTTNATTNNATATTNTYTNSSKSYTSSPSSVAHALAPPPPQQPALSPYNSSYNNHNNNNSFQQQQQTPMSTPLNGQHQQQPHHHSALQTPHTNNNNNSHHQQPKLSVSVGGQHTPQRSPSMDGSGFAVGVGVGGASLKVVVGSRPMSAAATTTTTTSPPPPPPVHLMQQQQPNCGNSNLSVCVGVPPPPPTNTTMNNASTLPDDDFFMDGCDNNTSSYQGAPLQHHNSINNNTNHPQYRTATPPPPPTMSSAAGTTQATSEWSGNNAYTNTNNNTNTATAPTLPTSVVVTVGGQVQRCPPMVNVVSVGVSGAQQQQTPGTSVNNNILNNTNASFPSNSHSSGYNNGNNTNNGNGNGYGGSQHYQEQKSGCYGYTADTYEFGAAHPYSSSNNNNNNNAGYSSYTNTNTNNNNSAMCGNGMLTNEEEAAMVGSLHQSYNGCGGGRSNTNGGAPYSNSNATTPTNAAHQVTISTPMLSGRVPSGRYTHQPYNSPTTMLRQTPQSTPQQRQHSATATNDCNGGSPAWGQTGSGSSKMVMNIPPPPPSAYALSPSTAPHAVVSAGGK